MTGRLRISSPRQRVSASAQGGGVGGGGPLSLGGGGGWGGGGARAPWGSEREDLRRFDLNEEMLRPAHQIGSQRGSSTGGGTGPFGDPIGPMGDRSKRGW